MCERFHRIVQDEFYAIAFRKKIYESLEEMQKDIDQWISFYHNKRTHSRRYCCGKTPMHTFINNKDLAKAKDINNLFGQISNFKLSDEAEAGSAEVQPVRNSLTGGNNKAVESKTTAFN